MSTSPALRKSPIPISTNSPRTSDPTPRKSRTWSGRSTNQKNINGRTTLRYQTRITSLLGCLAAIVLAGAAGAQEVKHYRFAHDQQLNSGYSIAYDIFSAKLKELSKGTMLVDQYPGAQLGQEPQILQLVKAGDLDFAIVSSANPSTISPQAGVMSLHFLFRDEAHVVKALADPKVIDAIKA